jgi:putative phosphonate metabolism protein
MSMEFAEALTSNIALARDHPMVKFPEPLAGPVESGPRHAIYFAPSAETALHRLGSEWLGRDSITDEPLTQPETPGLTAARLAEITGDPRRYGIHATLKPPFHLKPATTVEALLDAVRHVAKSHAPYEINLVLRRLSDFFALMQGQSRTDTRALAAAAVSELDGFRALPAERDLERRRKANLSGAQETLLQRWGYPYVMSEFRFHMTLSHRVTDDTEADAIRAALRSHFAEVLECPHVIDGIAVFRQESPDTPFIQIERFALG